MYCECMYVCAFSFHWVYAFLVMFRECMCSVYVLLQGMPLECIVYVYLTTCANNLNSCGNVTKCHNDINDVTHPPASWLRDHPDQKPDYNLE